MECDGNMSDPPRPKVIAIDVDGTLFDRRGHLNQRMVDWINAKYEDSYQIMIWSMRGREHAELAAERAGLWDIAQCCAKPGYVVDDKGWSWVKGTKVIKKINEQE